MSFTSHSNYLSSQASASRNAHAHHRSHSQDTWGDHGIHLAWQVSRESAKNSRAWICTSDPGARILLGSIQEEELPKLNKRTPCSSHAKSPFPTCFPCTQFLHARKRRMFVLVVLYIFLLTPKALTGPLLLKPLNPTSSPNLSLSLLSSLRPQNMSTHLPSLFLNSDSKCITQPPTPAPTLPKTNLRDCINAIDLLTAGDKTGAPM